MNFADGCRMVPLYEERPSQSLLEPPGASESPEPLPEPALPEPSPRALPEPSQILMLKVHVLDQKQRGEFQNGFQNWASEFPVNPEWKIAAFFIEKNR